MTVKSDNPNVKSIKHMAFGVKDAARALEAYAKFLHVPADTQLIDYPKSKNRVALFNLGGIEYQLCQSLEAGGDLVVDRGVDGHRHQPARLECVEGAERVREADHLRRHDARLGRFPRGVDLDKHRKAPTERLAAALERLGELERVEGVQFDGVLGDQPRLVRLEVADGRETDALGPDLLGLCREFLSLVLAEEHVPGPHRLTDR